MHVVGLRGATFEFVSFPAVSLHSWPRHALRESDNDAGKTTELKVMCPIDTPIELDYYCGGVLRYVLGQMLTGTSKTP